MAKNFFRIFTLNMVNTNYDSQITFGKKYCLIPKCKAHCCSNAPIPIRFLNQMKTFHQDKFIRRVYDVMPAPKNNPYCVDAVIPLTKKPLNSYPLKVIELNGKKAYALDMNEILNDEQNFCPFLTQYGRCNIYKSRPKVCRDFGVGDFYCDEQVSLKEYLGFFWNAYKKMVHQDFANCKKFIQDKLSK